MALITISKLLKEAGLDITKKIKLVRHKDGRKQQKIEGEIVEGNPYEWYVNHKRDNFLKYQAEQKNDVFKKVDYVVAFLGEEGTSSRMIGVYRVMGLDQEKMARLNTGGDDDHFYYIMEEIVPGFEELNERVIIDWGKSTINWHQWLDLDPEKDKKVIAIERAGIDWYCPDFEEIQLTYGQLKNIFEKSIPVWRNRLSSCNCIYVISDSNTGSLYVGSTYNKQGIWGRWGDYAATGHGNDVELVKLIEANPDYADKYFHWAILQTLPLGIDEDKAVAIETRWKEKLGRAACKLNRN